MQNTAKKTRRYAMPRSEENISYTIDDIYRLPDGKRAELIDGHMYLMAPPNRSHQKISWKLHQIIANYIDAKGGKCEVYAAPFSVFLTNDETTYVEPDLCVICDPSKLTKKGCKGAPDWVIEIVSSSSKNLDYMLKLFKYRTAGVREYWIVDQSMDRILVYHFETNTMEEHTFRDTVPAGIYDDLEIDFSGLDLE